MNKKFIGIDVGASKINGVVFDGKVKKKVVQDILIRTDRRKILHQLKDITRKLLDSYPNIKGIGLGVPGPLNVEKGLILDPPNIRGLHNVYLVKEIEKEFKIKTLLENDANCAALGESLYGVGSVLPLKKVLVMLTLGSGVGGGIVMDNKIYRGSTGSAGELGYMTIDSGGAECDRGFKGCFEAYTSQKFIKRLSKFNPEELREKARKGDKNSIKIFLEMGYWLGIGLSNIANILDPDIIVVGGGISQAGDLILKSARKEMKKRIFSPLTKKNIKVIKAKLGQDAGAVGAASLFY